MTAIVMAAVTIRRRKRIEVTQVIESIVRGTDFIGMDGVKKSKARILIDEFLSGKLPEVLQGRIARWMSKLSDGDEGMNVLQEVFEEFTKKYGRPDYRTDRLWLKSCRELGFTDRGGKKLLLHKKIMRVAAVVLPLMLIAGSGILLLFDGVDRGTETARNATVSTVMATEGPRKTVTLPCGTEVILKPGSGISYDETGYPDQRSVTLTGEAYFSVTGLQGRTFTVDAAGIKVTVLGTEFNVNTSGESNRTEVSLFSGTVEVQAQDRAIRLEPMQQFIRDNDTGSISIGEFDPEKVGGWRGVLSLDNVRLDDALRMIEDHFGVRVVADERTPGSKIVRAVLRDNTLEEVLTILRAADNDFDFNISANTVYIIGR